MIIGSRLVATLALGTILCCESFGQADLTGLPQIVQDQLLERYPGATIKKWIRGAYYFTVEFKQSDRKYEGTYDLKGAWVRTEYQILGRTLPVPVIEAMKERKLYGHLRVAYELHTPQQPLFYTVQFNGVSVNGKEFGVVSRPESLSFLPDGTVIGTEKGAEQKD